MSKCPVCNRETLKVTNDGNYSSFCIHYYDCDYCDFTHDDTFGDITNSAECFKREYADHVRALLYPLDEKLFYEPREGF